MGQGEGNRRFGRDRKSRSKHVAASLQLRRALRLSSFKPGEGVEFYEEQGRTRIVSIEEEQAYLATASQPLKDIARIILDTGMRPEEVFRIEVANLDFSKRTIFNPFGKTRAARRKITMTDEVYAILKACASDAKSRFVFASVDNPERPIGSVRKAHNAAIRRAKLRPAFRLYDLRHTYA
jgi:integrase